MSYRYEEDHGMTSPSPEEQQPTNNVKNGDVDEPFWKRYLRILKVFPAHSDEEESNDERILRISLWCIFLMNLVVAITFLAIQPSIPNCCGRPIFSTMLFEMDWNLLSRILPWMFLILVLLEGLTCSIIFLQPIYAMFIPMIGFFLLCLTFLDIGPSMTLFLFATMSISQFMRYVCYRLKNNRTRKTTRKRRQDDDDTQERRTPTATTSSSCFVVWALNINTLVELLVLVIIIMTFVAGGFCIFTDGGDNDSRPTFFAPTTDALAECPDCSEADIDSVCQICNIEMEHQCYFPFAWR